MKEKRCSHEPLEENSMEKGVGRIDWFLVRSQLQLDTSVMREMILRAPKGREIQGMTKELCSWTDDGTQRETSSYGGPRGV